MNLSVVIYPVITGLERLRQENLQFEASLGYISETLSQKTRKNQPKNQKNPGILLHGSGLLVYQR